VTQKQKRQRRQTQEQKEIQTQRFKETMANKKAKLLADKMESERAKHVNKKLNFFSAHNQRKITHDIVNDGITDEAMADVTVTGLTSVVQEEEDVLVVNNPNVISELRTTDVMNNLDFDEDDELREQESNTDDDYDDDEGDDCGVQQEYVKAIQKPVAGGMVWGLTGPAVPLSEFVRIYWWN